MGKKNIFRVPFILLLMVLKSNYERLAIYPLSGFLFSKVIKVMVYNRVYLGA